MKIVYTTGVFDLIHSGHISTLHRARSFGSYLIVGIQEDDSVLKQKGNLPVMTSFERKAFLESLPFVDECLVYDNIDQRPMLEKIKPDVMAQTEEWTAQTDRSDVINYLKSYDIELKLMNIQKKVSSTQIKKRVIESAGLFRNDVNILRSQLDVISFDSLILFEKFDPIRTERLVKKIFDEQDFFNPITVALYKGKYIVIDGVNRLEALRRLGVKNIFVCLVDYCSRSQVELKNNAHFLHLNKEKFYKLLDDNNIEYRFVEGVEVDQILNSGGVCAVIENGKKYLALSDHNPCSLVDFLNKLVTIYVGKYEVYRLSELSQDAQNFGLKVLFPLFKISQIVKMAEEGVYLQSGITWHALRNSIIHFSFPLSVLKEKTVKEAQLFLRTLVDKKIENKKVRYYPSNIYICDEWE